MNEVESYDKKLGYDSKKWIFLGYSINIRAYRVFKKCTKTLMKSINVIIDNDPENKKEEEDDKVPT